MKSSNKINISNYSYQVTNDDDDDDKEPFIITKKLFNSYENNLIFQSLSKKGDNLKNANGITNNDGGIDLALLRLLLNQHLNDLIDLVPNYNLIDRILTLSASQNINSSSSSSSSSTTETENRTNASINLGESCLTDNSMLLNEDDEQVPNKVLLKPKMIRVRNVGNLIKTKIANEEENIQNLPRVKLIQMNHVRKCFFKVKPGKLQIEIK